MSPEVALYITHYGYTAIFILIFLQEIGVPNPLPNEIVLMFSGYLTFTGVLLLPLVILTATCADFTGATILYGTFYFFGDYILSHKPKWLPISTDKINSISARVSKGGLWTVFLGRVTPFIRGYVSVISGLLKIKPKLYLPLVLITAVLVSSAYVLTGRLLGPYWAQAAATVVKVKYGVLALVVLVITWALIRHYNKKAKYKIKEDNG